MMSAMEIDKVLNVHNSAKKDSFDTVHHVDEPPKKAVNTYQESKMTFKGELEKREFSTLLTPSESMCSVLDIKEQTETAEENLCFKHKLKRGASTLKSASMTPSESFEDNEVLLGTGGTTVPRSEYEKLDFDKMKYTIAVRRLLNLKFTKEELATHSQTGRESPAFIGVKARKPQLDPVRVGDIRLHVAQKYNIDTSFVNNAITVALADARKSKKRKIKKNDSD
ncbi:hypothetical protein HHI36_015936 [Cryptolaemus montrouzieri]|uniref:BEN domain-containing protein n=1 Tax=Cryptolaemus montrouzieri TaxID=559131 RepID=A0ABD2N7A3_9CUCU